MGDLIVYNKREGRVKADNDFNKINCFLLGFCSPLAEFSYNLHSDSLSKSEIDCLRGNSYLFRFKQGVCPVNVKVIQDLKDEVIYTQVNAWDLTCGKRNGSCFLENLESFVFSLGFEKKVIGGEEIYEAVTNGRQRVLA